jgi:hypothetical protein
MIIFLILILAVPIVLVCAGYPRLLMISIVGVAVTAILALGFFLGLGFTWVCYTDAGWAAYNLESMIPTQFLATQYLEYIHDKPFIFQVFYLNVLFLDFYKEYILISLFHKVNFILWFFEILTFRILFVYGKAAHYYLIKDHTIESEKVSKPEVIKDRDFYIQKEKKDLQDLFDSRNK